VVAAEPVVGDDAPVLAAGPLEPVAVPFKQVVLPRLTENTKSNNKFHDIPPD
jgi:hypothetical protein